MCYLLRLLKLSASTSLVLCFSLFFITTSVANDTKYASDVRKFHKKHKPIIKGWEPVRSLPKYPLTNKLQLHPKPASLIKKLKKLTHEDYDTALHAVHFALSQGPDGSTYNWKRHKTNLNGKITPLNVFRDKDGKLCRHFIYTLSLDKYNKTIEGIACRSLNGNWNLSG